MPRGPAVTGQQEAVAFEKSVQMEAAWFGEGRVAGHPQMLCTCNERGKGDAHLVHEVVAQE